jgi:hypothetical protein
MSDWAELAQGWGKKAVTTLSAGNSGRTSMGVLFGVILQMLVVIFEPSLKRQQLFDFHHVTLTDFMCLGVFVFNATSALKRRPVNPQAEAVIALIKRAKRDGYLSVAQARRQYQNLLDRLIAQAEGQRPSK